MLQFIFGTKKPLDIRQNPTSNLVSFEQSAFTTAQETCNVAPLFYPDTRRKKKHISCVLNMSYKIFW